MNKEKAVLPFMFGEVECSNDGITWDLVKLIGYDSLDFNHPFLTKGAEKDFEELEAWYAKMRNKNTKEEF